MEVGQDVELWRFPPDESDLSDAEECAVLFEDDNIIVLDKPGDLAVHPSARYLLRTVTAWLKERDPEGPARLCHRLDRETSGVLLCAHDRQAESDLKTAFARGEIQKTYLAVVRGQYQGPALIDAPLELQGERGLVRIKMRVEASGQAAQTSVKTLFFDPAVARTLVSCQPRTGRQHQIRAHLAHAGHPLIGDKLYAMGERYFDAFTRGQAHEMPDQPLHPRQALHAHGLTFQWRQQSWRFISPLPQELCGLLPSFSSQAPGLFSQLTGPGRLFSEAD
jgi:23S rRNA pseudouridine1911/1915/1917 synthase